MANSFPPFLDNLILDIFFLIKAIGNSSPIRPVLQIAKFCSSHPKNSDVNFITSLASINPCSPTPQLAQPLLATTPLTNLPFILSLDAVTEWETIEF